MSLTPAAGWFRLSIYEQTDIVDVTCFCETATHMTYDEVSNGTNIHTPPSHDIPACPEFISIYI